MKPACAGGEGKKENGTAFTGAEKKGNFTQKKLRKPVAQSINTEMERKRRRTLQGEGKDLRKGGLEPISEHDSESVSLLLWKRKRRGGVDIMLASLPRRKGRILERWGG